MSIFSIFNNNDSKDENTPTTQSSWRDGASGSNWRDGSEQSSWRGGSTGASVTETTERGKLDRVLGVLGYTGVVEGLYNMVDDDEESTFLSGLGEGFKYMNPWEDDVSGRHFFSDVLEETKWEDNPDSKLDNIGRGAAGFLGDVLLDPLTYINPFGAAAKIAKGTGTAVKGVKTISTAEEAMKSAIKTSKTSNAISAIANKSLVKNAQYLRKANPDEIFDTLFKANTDADGVLIHSEEELRRSANDIAEKFNSEILKMKSGGQGLGVGLPFGKNKFEIISADTLRKIGDRTIAPYTNRLAKEIRIGKLGQSFSTKAQLEKNALVNFDETINTFIAKNQEEVFSNAKFYTAIESGDITNKILNDLTNQQIPIFINYIESGMYQKIMLNKTRRDILKSVAKQSGGVDREILNKTVKEHVKELDERLESMQKMYSSIMHKRRNPFVTAENKASKLERLKSQQAAIRKEFMRGETRLDWVGVNPEVIKTLNVDDVLKGIDDIDGNLRMGNSISNQIDVDMFDDDMFDAFVINHGDDVISNKVKELYTKLTEKPTENVNVLVPDDKNIMKKNSYKAYAKRIEDNRALIDDGSIFNIRENVKSYRLSHTLDKKIADIKVEPTVKIIDRSLDDMLDEIRNNYFDEYAKLKEEILSEADNAKLFGALDKIGEAVDSRVSVPSSGIGKPMQAKSHITRSKVTNTPLMDVLDSDMGEAVKKGTLIEEATQKLRDYLNDVVFENRKYNMYFEGDEEFASEVYKYHVNNTGRFSKSLDVLNEYNFNGEDAFEVMTMIREGSHEKLLKFLNKMEVSRQLDPIFYSHGVAPRATELLKLRKAVVEQSKDDIGKIDNKSFALSDKLDPDDIHDMGLWELRNVWKSTDKESMAAHGLANSLYNWKDVSDLRGQYILLDSKVKSADAPFVKTKGKTQIKVTDEERELLDVYSKVLERVSDNLNVSFNDLFKLPATDFEVLHDVWNQAKRELYALNKGRKYINRNSINTDINNVDELLEKAFAEGRTTTLESKNSSFLVDKQKDVKMDFEKDSLSEIFGDDLADAIRSSEFEFMQKTSKKLSDATPEELYKWAEILEMRTTNPFINSAGLIGYDADLSVEANIYKIAKNSGWEFKPRVDTVKKIETVAKNNGLVFEGEKTSVTKLKKIVANSRKEFKETFNEIAEIKKAIANYKHMEDLDPLRLTAYPMERTMEFPNIVSHKGKLKNVGAHKTQVKTYHPMGSDVQRKHMRKMRAHELNLQRLEDKLGSNAYGEKTGLYRKLEEITNRGTAAKALYDLPEINTKAVALDNPILTSDYRRSLRSVLKNTKNEIDELVAEREFIINHIGSSEAYVKQAPPPALGKSQALKEVETKLAVKDTGNPNSFKRLNEINVKLSELNTHYTVTNDELRLIGFRKNAEIAMSKNGMANDQYIKDMAYLGLDDYSKVLKKVSGTNKYNLVKHLHSIDDIAEIKKIAKESPELADYINNDYLVRREFFGTAGVEKMDKDIFEMCERRITGAINDAKKELEYIDEIFNDDLVELDIAAVNQLFEARELGVTLKETSMFDALDKDAQLSHALETWTSEMQKLGQREVDLGLLSQEQLDKMYGRYMHYALSDSAREYMKTLDDAQLKSLGYNPDYLGVKSGFDQHKKFRSLAEANEVMGKKTGVEEWFETDIATIFCARKIGSNNLISSKESMKLIKEGLSVKYEDAIPANMKLTLSYEDLIDRVIKRDNNIIRKNNFEAAKAGTKKKQHARTASLDFLDRIGIDKAMVTPNNPFVEITPDQLKKIQKYCAFDGSEELSGYCMYDGVLGTVNKATQAQLGVAEHGFWNVYDKLLSFYKSINTAITPGFHVQNTFGNAFNSFFYSGYSAFNPALLKHAHTIVKNPDPKQFINFERGALKGKELSYKQLNQMLADYEIIDGSFWGNEILDSDFVLIKQGKQLGTNIESTQRCAIFVEALKNGESPESAKAIVNRFLFDYGDLTDVEKHWFRRAMPFYTYMRKNVPLQLEMMIERPEVFRNLNYGLTEFQMISGEEYIPEENRNEWKQDYIQLPFVSMNDKPVGVSLQFPFEQLDRLSPNRLMGQATPLIKAPYEMYNKKYAYTGIPIGEDDNYFKSLFSPANTAAVAGKKFGEGEGNEKALYIASRLGAGMPAGTLEPQKTYAKSDFTSNLDKMSDVEIKEKYLDNDWMDEPVQEYVRNYLSERMVNGL